MKIIGFFNMCICVPVEGVHVGRGGMEARSFYFSGTVHLLETGSLTGLEFANHKLGIPK